MKFKTQAKIARKEGHSHLSCQAVHKDLSVLRTRPSFFLHLPFTVSIQSIACKRVFVWHVVRLSVALAVFCVCVSVENMCVSDRRRDQGGVYHYFL